MDNVKLFEGENISEIQRKVNIWVYDEKPEIKSSSISMTNRIEIVLAITYRLL